MTAQSDPINVTAASLAAEFREVVDSDTMPAGWTPVGAWVRVSSGGQDEENQVPKVMNHCIEHRYWPTRWYVLHDKSASKGEQQAKLDEMLTDMREGTIKVLIAWHSDRVERRGPEYVFKLLAQVRDAGGRIESTKEPLFGTTDMSGEAMTALSAVIAHQYSVHLAEQIKLAQERIRKNNAVITCLPWGYKPVGAKYSKCAVPSDECREYWPKVLDRCIAGDSCRTIAAWLDSQGVKPTRGGKWDEGVVRRYIRNPVYCGRRLGWADSAPLLKDEAVVSVNVWAEANHALKNRPKRGPRSPRLNPIRPMLANLRCFRCHSPMYRIHAGSRDGDKYYYRCAGSGPQRKGCGNMVRYTPLENVIVARMIAWNDEPHQNRKWTEGKNWDAEIADIRQILRELDPESEEDETRRDELKAQLREYRWKNEYEAKPGEWKYTDVCHPDGRVMTKGEHFYELDPDSRREYLKNRDIRAESVTGGFRFSIDGREDTFLYDSFEASVYEDLEIKL